ncbi:MAG: phage tail sheath family protein [Clostridia bacterium]
MSVFITQNKTRPGVYMNFESMSENLASVSDRGIAVLPLELDFLQVGEIFTVDVYTDFLSEFGISLSHNTILPIREALKNAESVMVYRLNSGEKAKIETESYTATAKFPGTYGNEIAFSVTVAPDDMFDVLIYVNNSLYETFTVSNFDEIDSKVIDFAGEIASFDKTLLENGTSDSANIDDYAKFFNIIAVEDFNTMAITSTDVNIKLSACAFSEEMRDNQGKKIQIIVENYPNADFEGVISVANGVVLEDGTKISASIATCYVAGAVAGCDINESLTYQVYSGSCEATPKYTNSEICTKLENGEFVFVTKRGQAIIEQDINSFTGYSPTKSNVFSKNRVIRVIDNIATDIKTLFEDYYLGKVSNNAEGRSLFCAECINYIRTLENIDCVQDFNSASDILVECGDDLDSVVVNLNIKPVDSIEKLYMTVLLS